MTKKFLNVAIGISLLICSVALLIFSAKQNPAQALPQTKSPDVLVAGTIFVAPYHYVIGYNVRTSEVVVLGKMDAKEIRRALD